MWQTLIGLFAAIYLAFSVSEVNNLKVLQLFYDWLKSGFALDLPAKTNLLLPFMKEVSYPLGMMGFIILSYLVIVGSSNAVNLTDGLDGLVIMPVILVGAALGAFAYVMGNAIYAKYLLFPYIPGAGELLIFCGAMGWSGFSFPLVQRTSSTGIYGRRWCLGSWGCTWNHRNHRSTRNSSICNGRYFCS
jgi:phospho-N-acetylmuramoyl-pentapeptide-transferase